MREKEKKTLEQVNKALQLSKIASLKGYIMGTARQLPFRDVKIQMI